MRHHQTLAKSGFFPRLQPERGAPARERRAAGLSMTDKRSKSDARISGMVAAAALVFLAIFVVALVWLAG